MRGKPNSSRLRHRAAPAPAWRCPAIIRASEDGGFRCATSHAASSTAHSIRAPSPWSAPEEAGNYTWLKRFQAYQAKFGQLFAVHTNPAPGRSKRSACHPSVADIPVQVDYVTCTVPRRVAIDVFTQCIQANVAAVSFFTSGFAEYDEEGAQLQQQLAELSRESGVALIGPNGMGLYNPAIYMPTRVGMPLGEGGPLGMVSQRHAPQLLRQAGLRCAWHPHRARREPGQRRRDRPRRLDGIHRRE